MTSYKISSDAGNDWEFELDDDGRLETVTGKWPDDRDVLVFDGPMPFATRSIKESVDPALTALARGSEVCYHSDHPCMTCFCTPSGGMRCVKMC